jgi:hypothetical protein
MVDNLEMLEIEIAGRDAFASPLRGETSLQPIQLLGVSQTELVLED